MHRNQIHFLYLKRNLNPHLYQENFDLQAIVIQMEQWLTHLFIQSVIKLISWSIASIDFSTHCYKWRIQKEETCPIVKMCFTFSATDWTINQNI